MELMKVRHLGEIDGACRPLEDAVVSPLGSEDAGPIRFIIGRTPTKTMVKRVEVINMPTFLKHTGRMTVAVLALAAAPGASVAQDEEARPRSHTRGLLLNLHVSAASLSTDGGSDSGGGGGVTIGYGVSRKVLLYLQFDGAAVDIRERGFEGRYGLGHGDLGIRYSFANESKPFIPYLTVAFTGLFAGADIRTSAFGSTDVSLRGGGLKLGGGFGYYFVPQLALDANLTFTLGQFSDLTIENVTIDFDNTKANTTRLELGLSWYPQGWEPT